MAKSATVQAAQKPPEEDKKVGGAVVPSAVPSGMPDYLVEAAEADAGKGVSTDKADNIVPLLYVLQPLSPQVDDNNPGARIPDARAGDIWLKNCSAKPIVHPDEGVLFQPCHFWKDFVQWVPREKGGGLVATHQEMPKEAKEVTNPKNPKTTIWLMPNGDEVKETRHHAGFIILDQNTILPYVINFTGTGHTVSKNWMFTLMSQRTPKGGILPSFAKLYRLTTRQRTNAFGKWHVIEPSDAGYVDAPGYARGRELHQAFVTGEKVADVEDVNVSGAQHDVPGDGAQHGGEMGDEKMPY